MGLITQARDADGYIGSGKCDVVLLGKEFLRNPHWPQYAARELGVEIKPPNQYELTCESTIQHCLHGADVLNMEYAGLRTRRAEQPSEPYKERGTS